MANIEASDAPHTKVVCGGSFLLIETSDVWSGVRRALNYEGRSAYRWLAGSTGARDDAQATIGAFGETQIRGALPDESQVSLERHTLRFP